MMDLLNAITPASVLPYCLLGMATFVEGPMTLLAAGAGVAAGALLPLPAFLSIAAGNLTADLGWYGLGRFGKPEWIERAAEKLGIDRRLIRHSAKDIRKHAARLVFLAKMTVGFPIPTLLALGLNRVRLQRWAWALAIGEVIKSALLLGAGYLAADSIQRTSGAARIALGTATAGLAIGLMLYLKAEKKKRLARIGAMGATPK